MSSYPFQNSQAAKCPACLHGSWRFLSRLWNSWVPSVQCRPSTLLQAFSYYLSLTVCRVSSFSAVADKGIRLAGGQGGKMCVQGSYQKNTLQVGTAWYLQGERQDWGKTNFQQPVIHLGLWSAHPCVQKRGHTFFERQVFSQIGNSRVREEGLRWEFRGMKKDLRGSRRIPPPNSLGSFWPLWARNVTCLISNQRMLLCQQMSI